MSSELGYDPERLSLVYSFTFLKLDSEPLLTLNLDPLLMLTRPTLYPQEFRGP